MQHFLSKNPSTPPSTPAPRPQNDTQLSPNLPGLTTHITSHDSAGHAIVESSTPAAWSPLLNNTMAMHVAYTTSEFPVSMSSEADLAAHRNLLAAGTLGLVNPNGTVARIVDFGPATEPLMHRTQSLDYGVVLEGEVEMVLDEGVSRVLRRGDVAVQRGTNHGWRNVSKTEWARMFFVLQDAKKVEVGGVALEEDLTNAGGNIPESGNK